MQLFPAGNLFKAFLNFVETVNNSCFPKFKNIVRCNLSNWKTSYIV